MDKNDKIEDEFDVKTDLSNKNSVDGLGYTESANNTNVGGRRCGKKNDLRGDTYRHLGWNVGRSLLDNHEEWKQEL